MEITLFMVTNYYCYMSWQFTMSGHTQLQGNAIMITSTISVVLFTNLVRVLPPVILFMSNNKIVIKIFFFFFFFL